MIFTGIQPSGTITLGNYLGSIKNFTTVNEPDLARLICIVDHHAYTIPNSNPSQLRNNIKSLVALYIAMDLHKNSHIFIQSAIKEHTELAWVLMCNTKLGELDRMTQFKDKSQKNISVSAGLYTYPVLMAADILLYDTTIVPVGIDQKQHVELTRDIAMRFNSFYNKEAFKIPEVQINEQTAKIYSLTDPTKKMSKSDENPKSYISLLDEPNVIRKKIKSATTDSIGIINYDFENQPGVSNLLVIYATIKQLTIEETVAYFNNQNYGFLKTEVAEAIISELTPIQERYHQIINDQELLQTVLDQGTEFATNIAKKKMKKIYKTIGYLV